MIDVCPESKALPEKLYKYYGNIDNVIKALKNKGVYMDNPANFNDPFDEMYTPIYFWSPIYKVWVLFQEVINYYLTSSEYINNYWGEIDFSKARTSIVKGHYEWVEDVHNVIHEFIRITGFTKIPADTVEEALKKNRFATRINIIDERARVTCFCETNKSIPMWAYYGKNHTGICIEYDTTLLNEEQKRLLQPVQYAENRNSDDVRYHKSKEWEHECEWRIRLDKNEVPQNGFLPLDCITGLYLGTRYDFSDDPEKEMIWFKPESFAAKKNDNYIRLIEAVKEQTHPVTLYKASTDFTDYKINFTPYYTFGVGD